MEFGGEQFEELKVEAMEEREDVRQDLFKKSKHRDLYDPGLIEELEEVF